MLFLIPRLLKTSLSAVFFLSISLPSCDTAAKEKELQNYNRQQDPLAIPDLLPRNAELAGAAEWPKTQAKLIELKSKLVKKPDDIKTRLQIATIFIAEQRITGEHHYYYTSIEKILDGVLSLDRKNFEAKVYKASLKMSLHQFAEAKRLAEEAKNINPENAYVYGILVDANVELGNYAEAVAMSDKMQALKPSLEAYARASYLREIYGDIPGAIEAMKLAVVAGLPGSEPQCWSRNILGDLYLNNGQIAEAENTYTENLIRRPSYAPSMAGLAKTAMKKKNYSRALALLDSANAVMPGAVYDEQKADVFAEMGKNEEASALYAKTQKQLIVDANTAQHSVALELAKSFEKTNRWDSAKKYILQEYSVRPNNIDVNNELAWISYNQQDFIQAKNYLKAAQITGSKNPELLRRATLITQRP